MNNFNNNQSVKNICDAIISSSCIAFIGSGLSAPVIRSNGQHIPTWDKLLDELVQNEIKDVQEAVELRELINQNQLLMVAQQITEEISRSRLEEYLTSIFDDPTITPTPNHMLIRDIGFRAVITSNYDRLIELAYDNKPPVYNQRDIQKHGELLNSSNKDFYIFKIHGDIKEPDTIILGTSDYNELFFKDIGYRRFLENIFVSNTIVFIGFGDNDPDITQTLMSNELLLQKENYRERHYILMDKSKSSSVIKNRLLKDKGLKVIEYNNFDKSHSQVGEFLEELSQQIAIRGNKIIDVNIQKSTNDISSIMFSYSEKYYRALRGSNGRFHHLCISDLLLTDVSESFLDTQIQVNDAVEQIPLHSSVEKLWQSKYMHSVLIGEGGMGKTVSVIRLWEKYLNDKGDNQPVPIFIALNEYNNSPPDEREYILKMIVLNYLGKKMMDYSDINRLWEFLCKPRKDGKPSLILFLDGFNEITVEKKNLIIELNKLIESAIATQIIITSRFDMRTVQNWNQINKLKLVKLSNEQIRKYIGGELFEKLVNNPLSKVLRNPMMLTIYNKSCTYINQGNSLFKFKIYVETSGELLWNYFEGQRMKMNVMYGGEENKKALYDLMLKYLLPYIGYKMESAKQFFLIEDEMEQIINEAYERFHSFDFLKMNPIICKNDEYLDIGSMEGNRRLKRFLRIKDILCCDLAVIIEENGTYRFLHQNFRDYFAAVHILNEIQTSLSVNRSLPEIMKISPISFYVGKYMGEIEGEHYNVPILDTRNGTWSAKHYKETRLGELLQRCRNIFDQSTGFAVWNIIEIWKNVRGELTGSDLSCQDLTNVVLNKVRCSRVHGNNPLAVVFDYSLLNERNILPQGHTDTVTSAVYSSDDKRILSASWDNTIKEWDTVTGECLRTYRGHSKYVTSAVYSGDGKRILSTSWDFTMKEWNAVTGECLRTYQGHSDNVTSAVYSSDGKRILSASRDYTIKEWDAVIGECLRTYQGHSDNVTSAVYSSDGKRILSASRDYTIKEWDAVTGECLRTNQGHTAIVTSAVYSSDGKRILSASWDNTIKEWDAMTGGCLRTYQGHSYVVNSAVYSSDGKQILSASWDHTIKEWDAVSGECLCTYQGHSKDVTSAVYSNDGKRILSASDDYAIKEWDMATGECLRTYQGYSEKVNSAVYSGDGKQILSAFWDDTMKEWDAVTGKCLRTYQGQSKDVTSAVYSCDDKRILSASWDHTIKEWDAVTGECLRTYQDHTDTVTSAVNSSDGKRILSASWDNTIKEWDTVTGECLRTYQGHSKDVNSAVYSSNGKRILSASNDNTMKEWDTATGEWDWEWECLRTYKGHSSSVTSAVYSSDGKQILSASGDNTMKVWDAVSGECLRTYQGHTDTVTSAVYSSDGKRILSASWDDTMKEWDAVTGKCLRTYQGHSTSVNSAVYSSDGKRILSASWDNTIKEWDAVTGKCIKTIESIPGLIIQGCSFSNLQAMSDISDRCMELLKMYGVKEITR